MKFLDYFSGIGGGRHGLELAGHECVGFCEADKYAIASYISMYLLTDEQREYLATLPLRQRQKEILKDKYRNGEWFCNDITKLKGIDVPQADIWCFGAPCQSFSVAGRRAGLEGQSGLVGEIFRILRETAEDNRPEWLIYENVKGMFSSNKGFDYFAILAEMDELGYDCQWDTLNSKYFGVPQNRERVYTLGHLRTRGGSAVKIFPLEGTDAEGSVPRINILAHYDGYRRNTQTFDPDGITEALSTCQGGGREHHTIVKIDPDIIVVGHTRLYKGVAKNDKERIFDINGVSSTMRASDYKEPQKVAIPVSHDSAVNKEDGIYVALGNDLIVYAVWYEKYNCYVAIRKLTPRECFRLQGFSDDLYERAEFVNSDTQLYKQSGNAITVPVAYEVGKRLKENESKN